MTEVPVPLDEFPIHQTPLSAGFVASSDRNFYDRYYFNAHDRTGDVFFVSGFGVYPNLGVKDAYAVVRRGNTQKVLRSSDAIDNDRLNPAVGPYRIEVIEPLRTIRLVCDAAPSGIAFDMTWHGSTPAVMEQPHVMRTGARPIIDASRFAQVGTWEGVIQVDGDEFKLDPDTWVGTRDRSWGIRPSGDPEPSGRSADEMIEGFWWLYVPLRFEDHAVIIIVQELPDGFRTLNDATRVWADGRREQLGWPEIEVDYESGTRHPIRARLHLKARGEATSTIEVNTKGFVALNVGCGYGGDPDWLHGQWKGRNWLDVTTYDMTDEAITSRVPFSVVDHVATAHYTSGSLAGTPDGAGLFEHGTFGRHDPSGFTDWGSVAP